MKTLFTLLPMRNKTLKGDAEIELSAQCYNCLHYNNFIKCKAFPNGIPNKIQFGKFDHTKPFPGDNGIRFEPINVEK